MEILRLLIDSVDEIQAGDLPDIEPEAVLEKWRRGVPALRGQWVPVPTVVKSLLPKLCGRLAEGGAGDSARHIQGALDAVEIDAGSLIAASLARNEKAIRTSSIHMGLAPDLVWLVGELASSPLANELQARLFGVPALQASLGDWNRGYCPSCGSWPALIEVVKSPERDDGSTAGQHRLLRCSYCAASW